MNNRAWDGTITFRMTKSSTRAPRYHKFMAELITPDKRLEDKPKLYVYLSASKLEPYYQVRDVVGHEIEVNKQDYENSVKVNLRSVVKDNFDSYALVFSRFKVIEG